MKCKSFTLGCACAILLAANVSAAEFSPQEIAAIREQIWTLYQIKKFQAEINAAPDAAMIMAADINNSAKAQAYLTKARKNFCQARKIPNCQLWVSDRINALSEDFQRLELISPQIAHTVAETYFFIEQGDSFATSALQAILVSRGQNPNIDDDFFNAHSAEIDQMLRQIQ